MLARAAAAVATTSSRPSSSDPPQAHDQHPRRESSSRQPAAYLDETGWWEGCARAWLWAAVTTWVTVFIVRLSRGAKIAQELVGERFRIWYELVLYTGAPMYR